MPLDVTCAARIILPFATRLIETGHDAVALLARHGLTIAGLSERELRLPHELAMAVIADAVRTTGDPALGVHAAACDRHGDFDVIEYAAASCATVGESLRLAARFIALMHDGLSMDVETSGPLAALRVRVRAGVVVAPAAIEFLFASLIEYGARFVGRRRRPLRVELAHAGPDDDRAHRLAFREVRFGAPDHVMCLLATALEVPHAAPDGPLLQILTCHASERMARLVPPARSLADRVRAIIADELCRGNPGAEHVARQLSLSLRTLHRRLSDERTAHGDLLEEVRRTLAMRHLDACVLSIGELSFQLGFAHPNAFHRAFKRWTGTTPARYRLLARRDGASAALE